MAICLLLVCTFPLLAQKIYQVNEVSEINLGDGRFLYRDTKKEKPLNGEFRIIDGYRSQYVQAEFKEGMFDGKYQEYSHNALRREGSYKEGRKNGLFREYVGGALTQEYTFRNDTLGGAVISYFQNGKVSRSAFFKMVGSMAILKNITMRPVKCARTITMKMVWSMAGNGLICKPDTTIPGLIPVSMANVRESMRSALLTQTLRRCWGNMRMG